MKSSPPDVAHESSRCQGADHVPEDHGEEQDHAVAPVVAVPVVELLEVIDVGVAECESPTVSHPASNVSLDLVGSGEAGGRMHGHVPGRPAEQNVQANRLLAIGQLLVKNLVRPDLEAPRG